VEGEGDFLGWGDLLRRAKRYRGWTRMELYITGVGQWEHGEWVGGFRATDWGLQ
jgi:hypothetical protein